MKNDQEPHLLSHDYDGIKEYDNPLPMWWLITFFGAIIFAYLYYLHYMTGAGPSLAEELETDMAHVQKLQSAHHGSESAPSDEEAAKLASSDTAKEKGRAVFEAKCAVCHGTKLEGNIGPNLTDDYWIHGQGSLKDVLAVVQNGVTDKGMPSWKDMLSSDDLQSVAAFVVSQHGTNPPNAKAPQGNKIAK